MSTHQITLGFTLLGDGNWRGGLNYQKVLLNLIAGPLSSSLSAKVFLSADQETLVAETFGNLGDNVSFISDARVRGAGAGSRAVQALIRGTDRDFENLVLEHDVDVVFENARFYGASFAKPLLVWIPDFQHRYLPHLFSRYSRMKRELGFRAQCRGRRTILLSSNTSRVDCEKFYPSSVGRTHVARFCGEIDVDAILKRADSVAADYSLPDQFFYLPNHFWAHKNHQLVFDALLALKNEDQLNQVPPVVMSGPTKDDRKHHSFEKFMDSAKNCGLSNSLRHLGLIPYIDVLALNAASIAVVNPSEFEGWASSVEEAKSLGSDLLISDLPVHREQAPDADFFDVRDVTALAGLLRHKVENISGNTSTEELHQRNSVRRSEFAQSFLKAVCDASLL